MYNNCKTKCLNWGFINLRWDGINTFLSLPRQSLHCGPSKGTKGFVRSYKNLQFYWILGAGQYLSQYL
jgi:serine carboxypeptidase 1